MRDDLGIGLAVEMTAARDQFVAQRLEILDDAVVDQRHLTRGVRVRVAGGRPAMRRPARVCDTDIARRRLGPKFISQLDELARGAPPLDRAVDRKSVGWGKMGE